MKKFLVTTVLALLLVIPVLAATNDFTADNNVTVDTVTGQGLSTTLLILNGSTAESWSFSSGIFTVTNPGAFKVGADGAAGSIKVKNAGGTVIACANNTTASSSYVTLPTASATYTIIPSTDTNCATLCATQTGVSTYYNDNGTYALPTCGALTCSSPYALSAASGSTSATCNPPGVAAGSPSGTSGQTTTTTQTPTTTTTTPTPTTTTTTESPTTTATTPTSAAAKATDMIKNILSEATTLFGGNSMQIAANMGIKVDAKTEDAAEAKYTAKLVSGLKNVTAEVKSAITNFVNYGTPTTKVLGAGERAGVVNSYKSAFGKVPATEAEWSDAIKIGNGRWPTQRSTESENNATTAFKKIYKRESDRKNQHDDAAVTVISYGLRPSNRNLNSEKAAIKSFRAIYGYDPKTATAWDIVRAIAYSGAKR